MNHTQIESLYRDYKPFVTSFFKKRVFDPFVVDDLTHQLFERLLSDNQNISIENKKAFLIKCAKNVLARHYSGLRDTEEIDDSHVDPKSENSPMDDNIDFNRFMGSLNPKANVYFELAATGLKDAEIMRVLKLSRRAVSKFRENIRKNAGKYIGQ